MQKWAAAYRKEHRDEFVTLFFVSLWTLFFVDLVKLFELTVVKDVHVRILVQFSHEISKTPRSAHYPAMYV